MSKSPAPAKRLKTGLASIAGRLFLMLVGNTWRVRFANPEVMDELVRRHGVLVLALWHGELLPLTWAHRGRDIAVLISMHNDGEIIARVVSGIGYRPIRGSTSREGLRALVAAIGELERGRTVGFTTDGPRGPRRIAARGAAAAALRAGAPLLALGCTVSSAWRLGSWDRFVVPKPFAQITVRYACALAPGAEVPPLEVVHERLQVAQMLVCEPDAPTSDPGAGS